MSIKVLFSVITALIVAVFAGVWLSDDAYAQRPVPNRPADKLRMLQRSLGQVTAIGADQFTVQKPNGEAQTFSITQETEFRKQGGEQAAFSDLKTGGWVSVIPSRPDPAAKEKTAKLVIILPEDFDPKNQQVNGGKVVGVDVAAGKFTLENRKGEAVTVNVSASTRFLGEAKNLASLQEGMLAMIVAQQGDDGGLTAEVVKAGFPIKKLAGEISAVDAASNTFTLSTRRDNTEVSFKVDGNTKFRSKDGAVKSLADLQAGMVGMVVARADSADENAQLTALQVIAGTADQLPKADQRILGKVVSVSGDTLTLETRNAGQVTIKVTPETRFLSRGDRFKSLADLKVGMPLAVAVEQLENGSYQAAAILAGEQPGAPFLHNLRIRFPRFGGKNAGTP